MAPSPTTDSTSYFPILLSRVWATTGLGECRGATISSLSVRMQQDPPDGHAEITLVRRIRSLAVTLSTAHHQFPGSGDAGVNNRLFAHRLAATRLRTIGRAHPGRRAN